MIQYLELLDKILTAGNLRSDRTGTGTYSLFGYQMRFNLAQGFPLVTTKQCHLKSIIYELLWFIKGDTNVEYLQRHGVKIWNDWANESGDLGPIYGKQWRSWDGGDHKSIDQLMLVVDEIKMNPSSRRLVVNSWNPSVLPDPKISPADNASAGKQALPPCHCLFQFYVQAGKLSCQLYQRSADVFLGVPFNIASYALLVHMIAHITQLEVGEFIHTFGDVHLYVNHLEQAKLQLSRQPLPLPTLELNPSVKALDQFTFEDFNLLNYQYHPAIKAPIAV